jgi:hypothetical protein
MKPEDDYFDARVTVLSEMIKHHVKGTIDARFPRFDFRGRSRLGRAMGK